MICNQVTYADEVILTIYHKDFDEAVGSRELSFAEEIEGDTVIFTETLVADEEVERSIENWQIKEDGLLKAGSVMNPYGDQASAEIQHYRCLKKPSTLFIQQDNTYELLISTKSFIEISEFIEKYTGFKIEEFPMLYGDTLIFKSYKAEFSNKDGKGIILKNLPEDSTFIVKFKMDELLVASKIIQIETETDICEVSTGEEWDNIDLEVYQWEKLVYMREDISYMKSLSINTGITTTTPVDLDTLESEISLQLETGHLETTVGETLNRYETLLNKSSNKIKKKLRDEKSQSLTTFIQPGEGQKAHELIVNELQKNSDELWIFDPYFTDGNSKGKMIDWLRVLVESPAISKNIVFNSNTSSLDINDVSGIIDQDSILSQYNYLGITLWQTNRGIHDRFILLEKDSDYSGVTIGTSFNSLEDNYFCITPLNQKAVKIILSDLKTFLEEESKQREV